MSKHEERETNLRERFNKNLERERERACPSGRRRRRKPSRAAACRGPNAFVDFRERVREREVACTNFSFYPVCGFYCSQS